MPELVKLQKHFMDRGVTIIGVTDQDMQELKPFLDKKSHHDESITYRELTSAYCLAADPDGSVFDDYLRGIERPGFPTVAIIGKTGLIEYTGSANGLKSSLESIVNGTWDREAWRKTQAANLAARKIMLQIHDLKKLHKIEEAIEILNRQVAIVDQRLRTTSYKMQMPSARRKKMEPESWLLLEQNLIDAAGESRRWHSNRFSTLLDIRPSLAVHRFHQMTENHAGSLDDQINLAWRVYLASLDNDKLDKRLIDAARQLAKSVSEQAPENTIILDVYAHLLYASGEIASSVATFEMAIKNSNDENRAEIESDFKAVLKLMGK